MENSRAYAHTHTRARKGILDNTALLSHATPVFPEKSSIHNHISCIYQIGSEIAKTGRAILYPDGGVDVLVASKPIFVPPGWETDRQRHEMELTDDEVMDRLEGDLNGGLGVWAPDNRSEKQRAKSKVRKLALCTPFKYFVTLTIDERFMNRYDIKVITKRLNYWLNNHVKRDNLTYILVPELHRDGAIHFHGFFNDALPVKDSGTLTKTGEGKPRYPRWPAEREYLLSEGWRVVYNLPAWEFGFTTAIEIYGDYRRAVGYMCKYIRKQAEKIGGRYYYSGGNLIRPKMTYFDMPIEDLEKLNGSYKFTVDEIGTEICGLSVEPDAAQGIRGKISELTFSGLTNGEENPVAALISAVMGAATMERNGEDNENGISLEERG